MLPGSTVDEFARVRTVVRLANQHRRNVSNRLRMSITWRAKYWSFPSKNVVVNTRNGATVQPVT